MTHHENESIIDKVKNALGMGGHDDHDDHADHSDHAGHDHAGDAHEEVVSTPGSTMRDDVDNRPAGPDYAASDTDPDAGAALGRGSVAEPATTGTAPADAPMTRGEAASGHSGMVDEDGTVGTDRNEPGI